ncbi:MAG: thioesterase family protein [Sphingomicrobium sp.]
MRVSKPHRRSRGDYRAWSKVSLRWADNDVYGHVNNTVYYEWFDSALNSWLVGEGLLDLQNGSPIGLVVATACDYFAPIAFPGAVEVGLGVYRIGRSSVTYCIGVFAEGAIEPAAQGSLTHVYVGRESRRPVELPESWRAALEDLA